MTVESLKISKWNTLLAFISMYHSSSSVFMTNIIHHRAASMELPSGQNYEFKI